MNLFQVKQDQTVKIIDLKKGEQYQDKNDPVLERLELLGFRVGESLQVLAKGLLVVILCWFKSKPHVSP